MNEKEKTTMRAWPQTGTVPIDELLNPILYILRRPHPLRFATASDGEFHYDGYDIGEAEKATNCSPDVSFSRAGLLHAAEQGRGLLDVALTVAFQLGVEQGRRIVSRQLDVERDALQLDVEKDALREQVAIPLKELEEFFITTCSECGSEFKRNHIASSERWVRAFLGGCNPCPDCLVSLDKFDCPYCGKNCNDDTHPTSVCDECCISIEDNEFYCSSCKERLDQELAERIARTRDGAP